MEKRLIVHPKLPDNDRYYISEDGHVYDSKTGMEIEATIMKEKPYSCGTVRKPYLVIGLDGKMFKVHRLVAMTFIKYPFGDVNALTVNHKDGNIYNNHYTNLSWCSQAQNVKHAFKTGLSSGVHRRGEDQYRSKLTVDKVHEICALLTENPDLSRYEIAMMANVHWHYVDDICRYKSWAHIALQYDFIPKINIRTHLNEIVQVIKYIRKGMICNEILHKMKIPIKNGNTGFRGRYKFAKYKLIPMLERIGYYNMICPHSVILKNAILKYCYPLQYGSVDDYKLG